MPKVRPTDTEMCNREVRAILAAGQVRQAVTDDDVAKYMGVVPRTYQRRKKEPGDFSLRELRAIVKVMRLSDQEIVALIKGR